MVIRNWQTFPSHDKLKKKKIKIVLFMIQKTPTNPTVQSVSQSVSYRVIQGVCVCKRNYVARLIKIKSIFNMSVCCKWVLVPMILCLCVKDNDHYEMMLLKIF